jgi:threonine dehydrogenase-like Zn-dependent dehydrogenase
MAGTVVALGLEVTKFKLGDRVSSFNPHSQYFVAPQDHLFAIPNAISDDEAIWATLTTTQLGVRRAEMVMGESAAVVGLGILGQLVTQYLCQRSPQDHCHRHLSGTTGVSSKEWSYAYDLSAGRRSCR